MTLLSDLVESVFLHGDCRSYWKPRHFGLEGIPFSCRAGNGTEVSGVRVCAAGSRPPRGVVLFLHCGQCNAGFHLPQAAFLAAGGFDVVLFDYGGMGESTGRSRLSGLLPESAAVLDAVVRGTAGGPAASRVVLFGQGVGADAALQLRAARPDCVRGLILESLYADRRAWLRDRYGPGLGTLAARLLPCSAPEPAEMLVSGPVPVLLVRPGRDAFVREGQRRAVAASAPESAELLDVPGAGFLGVFAGEDDGPCRRVLEFVGRCLRRDAAQERRIRGA